MNEKRTQDANAGLLICQHCGVVLRQRVKNCRDCGNVMSRYSPTVMPNLVIKRAPASSPQNLRPENDPLLMERVITRCKFNEAMTPKPRQFRGSRAFLSENGDEQPSSAGARDRAVAVADAKPEPPMNALAQGMFADFGPPQPAKTAEPNDFFRAAIRTGEAVPRDSDQRQVETAEQKPFAEAHTAGGRPNDASSTSAMLAELLPINDVARHPPSPLDKPSKVVKAAHPSYMVADWLLLVVQENDGQTLSVTRSSEPREGELVFGLLPCSNDFNLVFPQELPPNAVSLSANALSFHDANNESDFERRDNDSSLNIDSRLAFEEGLSRISKMKLQGGLARSAVVGFETPESPDELRDKFVRKNDLPVNDLELPDATASDALPEVKKPKERSVLNPKRAQLDQEIDIAKMKAEAKAAARPKPKKNPMAVVVAVLGIVGVLAVVGFVVYTKIGEFTGGASKSIATTGGASQLPGQWHLVLSREDGQPFQDFAMEIQQSGNSFTGKGRDNIGDFTLSGELSKGAAVTLQKQYESAGYIWPIVFSGNLTQNPDGTFASGNFVWRKSDVERVKGAWKAGLPLTPQQMQQQFQQQMQAQQQGAQGQPGMQRPGMPGQQGFSPQGGPQGFPQQQPGFPQQGGMPPGGVQQGGMPQQGMPTQGGFSLPGGNGFGGR